MEGNVLARPTFCGKATTSLQRLAQPFVPLLEGQTPAPIVGTSTGPAARLVTGRRAQWRRVLSGGEWWSGVIDLELLLEQEVTGHIFVQALLVQLPPAVRPVAGGESLSRVDEELFEDSVERLGVSGGSAAFFKLRLKSQSRPMDYFIGKDLSHAEDEVNFYEEALQLQRQRGAAGLGPLLGYTLEYAGVLTHTEIHPRAAGRTELLVMRNLRCGAVKFRFLDIKIGQKTAQVGWQGKSRAAALRQSLVDGITNSSCEGFRLEGFDGRPPALESMDPLLDLGMSGNAKMAHKALRVMLQRMPAVEMLLHWLDLHQEPLDVEDHELPGRLCTTELAEVVGHEAVRGLYGLAVACRRSPVPQKWIGSSVGLGFDAGHVPKREHGEEEVRKSTVVCIFDWGRSELNTMQKHMQLSEKDQLDRIEFWRYYMGGIDRLAWEAARAYHHRFSCRKWSLLTFKVCDFDSMSENDFIGRLSVPVEETSGEVCAELSSKDRNHVVGDYWRGAATLTYSITWRAFPQPSRLKGAWRVHLIRAQHLPRQDKMQLRTTSDPMCEITACAEDEHGLLCLRQVSSVKVRHLDPEWGETFDLPVATEERISLENLFLPEKIPQWIKDQLMNGRSSSRWSWTESHQETEALEKALDTWKSRLDLASATVEDAFEAWSSGKDFKDSKEESKLTVPREENKWTVRVIDTDRGRAPEPVARFVWFVVAPGSRALEAAVLSELDARNLCDAWCFKRHPFGRTNAAIQRVCGDDQVPPELSGRWVSIDRRSEHQRVRMISCPHLPFERPSFRPSSAPFEGAQVSQLGAVPAVWETRCFRESERSLCGGRPMSCTSGRGTELAHVASRAQDASPGRVKPRLRVGCAVGITASPVQFGIVHHGSVEQLPFHLHWVKCPPDADAVLAMLGAGLLDVAILHTEDVVHAVSMGSSLRICGTYTSSPRCFGLYILNQKKDEESETLRSPCGLLHNSLGSQLALHILGQERDWRAQGDLYLRQLASLDAAKTALASGRVQALLWERHMAYDCVSSGEWVEAWQATLPWSSSLYVATRDSAYAKAKSIQSFIQWTRSCSEEFLEADSAEAAGQLLANSYRLTGLAVIAWLSSMRWWCRSEVRKGDLTDTLKHLLLANLIKSPSHLNHPVKSVARSFCELLEEGKLESYGSQRGGHLEEEGWVPLDTFTSGSANRLFDMARGYPLQQNGLHEYIIERRSMARDES
ncbi:unnamed protein product [Durusdinium trenchii]|uniref:C2 domain-containing protein n=1 Tax=Durusdinium trenchii TaxID=1381693 RepID=A0ABP0H6Z5_9DINO